MQPAQAEHALLVQTAARPLPEPDKSEKAATREDHVERPG